MPVHTGDPAGQFIITYDVEKNGMQHSNFGAFSFQVHQQFRGAGSVGSSSRHGHKLPRVQAVHAPLHAIVTEPRPAADSRLAAQGREESEKVPVMLH